MSNKQIVRKIYHEDKINEISKKIKMLGTTKIDVIMFLNIRLLGTMIIFLVTLYMTNVGFIFAPLCSLAFYYGYYYYVITSPLKKRVLKLDREALYFFEILTLTLESGRNLENALKITVDNVESELSCEFRKSLDELHYGKSLFEALGNMKERIPSETINNIILNITQTNIFGNSILETMNNQIDFLRDKKILEIKGQINKIPTKISIISVLFIIPLILLLILGPFLINYLV